ncbi:MAG: PHP domain-containing protein [Candidatus Nanopelagicaceae bacterium]|nr:PHP domain-containing protein [Candidatus Nanopelagicaceae bacterium]
MIDIHAHTTVSDGTDSPRALVNNAIIQGLDVLGLTDHDSIAGWEEASGAIRGKLQLALGAEISCLTLSGLSVHMVGLLFDGSDIAMLEMLEHTRDDRIPRMIKMIELLNADGISVTMEDINAVKPPGATLGRPHLADALVSLGFIKSRDDAFKGLLNNESKYYVAHMAPTPEIAIAQIRASGGVAIIAHPFASHRGETLSPDDFLPLLEAGLNGIEVDHRDQSPEERKILKEIARALDLAVTGSSDYHGTGKLNRLGENVTAPEEWAKLESQARGKVVQI